MNEFLFSLFFYDSHSTHPHIESTTTHSTSQFSPTDTDPTAMGCFQFYFSHSFSIYCYLLNYGIFSDINADDDNINDDNVDDDKTMRSKYMTIYTVSNVP